MAITAATRDNYRLTFTIPVTRLPTTWLIAQMLPLPFPHMPRLLRGLRPLAGREGFDRAESAGAREASRAMCSRSGYNA